jgi:cysteinyl-tRNA synthetase
MINSLFPDGRIDIHGGGFDLKFPHHENEIAQSKAHNHNAIATYWMHNGFINFGEDKMSKSLGNVILAKDAINKYGGSVIRLLLLATYYRAPLSLTDEVVETAQSEHSKIENTIRQLAVSLQLNNIALETNKKPDIGVFLSHLCDDLNTPNALTELFAIIKKANSALRQKQIDYSILKAFYLQLRDMLNILGIDIRIPLLSEDDKRLYADYLISKGDKNFAESDRLRQILIGKGIL